VEVLSRDAWTREAELEETKKPTPYGKGSGWARAANAAVADWRKASLRDQAAVNRGLVKILGAYHREVIRETKRVYTGGAVLPADLERLDFRLRMVAREFAADLRNLVQGSVISSVDAALIRETDLAIATYAKGLPQSIQKALASPWAHDAAKNAIAKVLTDTALGGGVRLTDKLWLLGEHAQSRVSAVVRTGIEKGLHPVELSKLLEAELKPTAAPSRGIARADRIWSRANAPERLKGLIGSAPGGLRTRRGTVSYNYLRIARTEMFRAHRAAHLIRTDFFQQLPKELNPVQGVQWNLSLSHPARDICDTWASQNAHGLGSGVYPAESLPLGHANDLCFTTTAMATPEAFAKSLRAFVSGGGGDYDRAALLIHARAGQYLSAGMRNALSRLPLGDPAPLPREAAAMARFLRDRRR
jgi:hypothetical protein